MLVPDDGSWLVGYDGRERSEGAIRLVRWLDRHARTKWTFRGVHVLEHHTDAPYEPVDDNEAMQREDTRALLEHHRIEPPLAGMKIVHGEQVADALEALASDQHADGLVIGRAAPTGSRSMVRLGRVARRLVAHAALPVVVVPPELQDETLARGPIIVGCDLTEGSASAARFGVELATALGRDCVLVHVAGEELPGRRTAIPAVDVSEGLEASRSRVEERFSAWAVTHGVPCLPRAAVPGPAVSGLLAEARERSACAVVVGSRRLSTARRVFEHSVSSHLAAASWLPVFVVPHVGQPSE